MDLTSRLRSVNPMVFQASMIALGLGGVLVGILLWYSSQNKVEVQVISDQTNQVVAKILVDVQGAVRQPGVYSLSDEARVKDALIAAGGLAENADREWVAKTLNLAQKLTDGIKIYIPGKDQKSPGGSAVLGTNNSLVNINNCSLSELDALPGIGATRGQAIIDGRPYTSTEELVSRKIVSPLVFSKIKDLISVY